MRYVHCPVHTFVVGQAHGSAAMILAAGSRGHRTALPNVAVSIRATQSPELVGTIKHKNVLKREMEYSRKVMAELLAEVCRKEVHQVLADIQQGAVMTAQVRHHFGVVTA